MLQWIEIDLLMVDETYQREFGKANVEAAQRIAAVFDWSKFSAVHVAPIEGGRFAIIDGQHRTHAAAACGFASVPCQVTPMTQKQQASAFAAINGFATAVTVWQLFRAALAAGEGWAVQVRDVCEAAGCRAMTVNLTAKSKKPGEIFAVTHLRRLISQHGPGKVRDVLRIIRYAGQTAEDPATWAAGFFKPVFAAIVTRPHVLHDPALASRTLAKMSLWRLLEQADRLNVDRRTSGLPPIQRSDALESLIGDALDKAMARAII